MHKFTCYHSNSLLGEEKEFWIRDSEKSKRTTKHNIMEIKQSIIKANFNSLHKELRSWSVNDSNQEGIYYSSNSGGRINRNHQYLPCEMLYYSSNGSHIQKPIILNEWVIHIFPF